MTARRVAGAFLALLGAVGVTASAYLNWFGDQTPQSIPIDRLFQTGVTEQASSYWTSVAVALAIVTVFAVVGLVLRSRLVLVVGWLIGAATLVLFVVQQARDSADFSINDVQAGVWIALVGLIVMLLGLATMGGRPARTVEQPETEEPEAVIAREDERPSSSTDRIVPGAALSATEPRATEPRTGQYEETERPDQYDDAERPDQYDEIRRRRTEPPRPA